VVFNAAAVLPCVPCLALPGVALQGRIDMRTLATARMITECTSLLLAGIVVLSMLGINISALLLPAGVVLAIASRDLLQNFIAGEKGLARLLQDKTRQLRGRTQGSTSLQADVAHPLASAVPFLSGIGWAIRNPPHN